MTVAYDEKGKLVGIRTIVLSAQHNPEVNPKQMENDLKGLIWNCLPQSLLKDTKIYINPTGRFVTGGPHGDSGLTGRKIIVDTYGGHAHHGGGAFSGKDCTKVDRSAAYYGRYAANRIHRAESKNIFNRTEPVQPSISFYVAECMEYPVIGEYHENLSLQEAYELYQNIPPECMNGVKGIGFRLEDGSIYDGLFELMSGGTVIKDIINEIPHYKESPLVQKAIADMEKILSEYQEKKVAPIVEEQRMEQPEKPPAGKEKADMETVEKVDLKPEKAPEKVLETHSSVPEGTGRKQSVLKALRERQAKLKSQEQKGTEQRSQGREKGEQEL